MRVEKGVLFVNDEVFLYPSLDFSPDYLLAEKVLFSSNVLKVVVVEYEVEDFYITGVYTFTNSSCRLLLYFRPFREVVLAGVYGPLLKGIKGHVRLYRSALSEVSKFLVNDFLTPKTLIKINSINVSLGNDKFSLFLENDTVLTKCIEPFRVKPPQTFSLKIYLTLSREEPLTKLEENLKTGEKNLLLREKIFEHLYYTTGNLIYEPYSFNGFTNYVLRKKIDLTDLPSTYYWSKLTNVVIGDISEYTFLKADQVKDDIYNIKNLFSLSINFEEFINNVNEYKYLGKEFLDLVSLFQANYFVQKINPVFLYSRHSSFPLYNILRERIFKRINFEDKSSKIYVFSRKPVKIENGKEIKRFKYYQIFYVDSNMQFVKILDEEGS